VFTGLIEQTGTLVRTAKQGGGVRLEIACRFPARDPRPGDSVSVDGACLTVTKRTAAGFETFAAAETVRRTNCGTWARGRRLNLERALRATDRFGGHIVQGHVDGRAVLLQVRTEGDSRIHRWSVPLDLESALVEKGSVALDGVSLTITGTGRAAGKSWFEVMLIPHTLASTNLGERRKGDGANVETDLLARFVRRHLELSGPGPRLRGRRPDLQNRRR
jgi:riboflavin synthase